MSKSTDNASKNSIRKTLAECDSYKQTTEVLVALGTVFKNHYKASIGMGREVKRKAADGTILHDPVTPDMMAQGHNLSVVVEIKTGFPAGMRARQKIFKQLQKYDCRLVGWMVKDVEKHDIVVLTRTQNAVRMSDYLQARIKAGDHKFLNPLCVVEFARLDARETAYFIRIKSGAFTNTKLQSFMRNGIEISADSVVDEFSTAWFYDSEPDPAYAMSILWEKIFSAMIPGTAFKDIQGQKKFHCVLLSMRLSRSFVRLQPQSRYFQGVSGLSRQWTVW